LLTCSDYVTERTRICFPRFANRVHTLYNGTDVQRFSPSVQEAVKNEQPPRLLFVGRLSPEKGVHTLIDAFQRVQAVIPRCQLDLVGSARLFAYAFVVACDNDGQVRKKLDRFYGLTLRSKLENQVVWRDGGYFKECTRGVCPSVLQNITYHGAMANDETAKFYQRADLFVFPPVWNEAFGIPVVEAMASGLAVVATRSGGIPEFIGDAGILVPRSDPESLAEAIIKLLKDPETRRSMGAVGRERALTRFSWDRIAEDLESHYDRLLAV
ncbi:MAG: glycosyltransferase family 4 protein, partial [Pyrinomonadaceae bacterium]